jgi:hypothetical protein
VHRKRKELTWERKQVVESLEDGVGVEWLAFGHGVEREVFWF